MCCQNEIHGVIEDRIRGTKRHLHLANSSPIASEEEIGDTCGRVWHATAAHCVLDIDSAGDRGEEREIHSVMGNSTVRLLPKPIFEIT
jgi:hypothetical protein